jgi:hypothetical protein
MSLESVEEVETDPTGSLEEVTTEPLGLTSTSPTASTSAASEFEGAPPPRRRSLSKLRRRLSRTFRLSFSGSLSDFAQNFSIDERGETSEQDLEQERQDHLMLKIFCLISLTVGHLVF